MYFNKRIAYSVQKYLLTDKNNATKQKKMQNSNLMNDENQCVARNRMRINEF